MSKKLLNDEKQKFNFQINENQIEYSNKVFVYYHNLNEFELFEKIDELLDDIIPELLDEIKPKDFNDKEKIIEMIMKKKNSIIDYYNKLIDIDEDYHDNLLYYRRLITKYRDLYNNLSIFNVTEKKRMLEISVTIQKLIIETFMDYYNGFISIKQLYLEDFEYINNIMKKLKINLRQ